MSARHLPSSDYLALHAATRNLVKTAGGGVQAASVTRVSQQRLSEYGLVDTDRFMPIDIVDDLEAEVGPVVTAQLAALSGHLLVPMPAAGRDGGVLGRVTAEAMRDTSAVFITIADIMKDGRITQEERHRLGAAVREALSKLVELKLQVAAESEIDE